MAIPEREIRSKEVFFCFLIMGKLSPCLYAGGKGPRNEKDDNSGEKEDVAG